MLECDLCGGAWWLVPIKDNPLFTFFFHTGQSWLPDVMPVYESQNYELYKTTGLDPHP